MIGIGTSKGGLEPSKGVQCVGSVLCCWGGHIRHYVGTYVALLLYLWVVWRTLAWLHPVCFLVWLSCARRSQLESFVHLARRITNHRDAIEANLDYGLSQGLIESTNTKIRLLTRVAFGVHGP